MSKSVCDGVAWVSRIAVAQHAADRMSDFASASASSDDLKMTMTANICGIPEDSYVAFFNKMTNLGPDGSDNIVMQNPTSPDWSYAGI